MPPSDYVYGQASVPPRKSGMTTPGKVLFFVGLLLSILAVAVAVWGIWNTVQTASDMQADAITVADTATVPMQEGQVRLVLADQGTSPSCSVTAPSGADVPVSQDAAFEAAAQEGVTVVGTITASETGEHTIACDAEALLSPALGLEDVTGVVAAGIAFLALFPLALITLLGLILWLVGRSRDKSAALAASGHGGAGGYRAHSGYDPRSGYDPGAGSYGQDQPYDQGQPYGSSADLPYGQGQPYGSSADQPYGQGQGSHQDAPPPPGSGGYQSAPPPPPGPSSDPYAAPPDGPEEDRGDQQR